MAKVMTCLFIESGQMTVDSISERIGVRCDHSWNKGDPRGKTGKYFTTNAWQLGSSVNADEDSTELLTQIQQSLVDLLNKITGHEESFRSTAMMGVSGLLLGITAEAPPSIIFDANIIKRISVLGVDLEIDFVLA